MKPSPPVSPFHFPLAKGFQWEYDFAIADDLGHEDKNILTAVGKYFGYEFKGLVTDNEMNDDYNIIRRVDQVIDVRTISDLPVYLVETRNYNGSGNEVLHYATAMWQDPEGYKLYNLLSTEDEKEPSKPDEEIVTGDHVSIYQSDIFAKRMQQGQLFLKLPLVLGAQWDVDTLEREEEVWAPAGWFNCLVVRRALNLYGKEQIDEFYYADGVGLVKVITPFYSVTLSDIKLSSSY